MLSLDNRQFFMAQHILGGGSFFNINSHFFSSHRFMNNKRLDWIFYKCAHALRNIEDDVGLIECLKVDGVIINQITITPKILFLLFFCFCFRSTQDSDNVKKTNTMRACAYLKPPLPFYVMGMFRSISSSLKRLWCRRGWFLKIDKITFSIK